VSLRRTEEPKNNPGTYTHEKKEGRKEGMGRRKKRGYLQGPMCWCQSKDLPVPLPC